MIPTLPGEEKRYTSADAAPTSAWTAQLIAELQRSIAAANLQRESDDSGVGNDTDSVGQSSVLYD